MKRFDLGEIFIQQLAAEEIRAVVDVTEDTLGSTYDAYHSADEEQPEDDVEDDRPPFQFFGSHGAGYKIVDAGEVIGGIFLSFEPFDPNVKTATLCLFGIKEEKQGRGIGLRVWKKIEEIHSDIKIWRLHTPAYAIRNVAFYVNLCGFVLYEITKGDKRYDWYMFRMRKVMP